MTTNLSGRAKGGLARARSLTATERKAQAKRAAETRWGELPRAIAGSEDTPLRIADMELDCYVLEDGTRVLSQAGFLTALGRHPKLRTRSAEGVPPILQSAALRPFITEETLEHSQPIAFRTPSGTRASGYRAELLTEVCEMYLKARDSGTLAKNQEHVARQADILIRALATVGIVALVDEATGYQEIRARDALAAILQAFVAQELQPWLKTFPNDFYKELSRLRGIEYQSGSVRHPQYFGHLTNEIVYRRLAPGVLDELKRVTDSDEDGQPKHRYHQRLTQNIGYPKLREHLGSVVTLMKLSKTWDEFMEHLNHLHPRWDKTIPLPLEFAE